MRAFVTGSTGFLGSNLVSALNRRGVQVKAFHRSTSKLLALEGLEYEEVVGDLMDVDTMAEAMSDCDLVFHVAAVADYWRNGSEDLYRVNVGGTKAVLAAAMKAGVDRLVFTSSEAALGVPPKGTLGDESLQFNLPPGLFPYGHSKYLAEQEVRRATQQGLDAVIVNPGVIIGPRDLNLISGSILIEAARHGIPAYMDGGTNMIAVEDAVAGEIAAAEQGRTGERYILGTENLTHWETACMACQVVGCKLPKVKVPGWLLRRAGQIALRAPARYRRLLPLDGSQMILGTEYFFFDNSKARRELGLPHTPIIQAMQETYEWYEEQGYI